VKLAILDRDGVINEDSDDYIKTPDEWHAVPGSLEAIARLSRAGWRVVVASNQSGVARGYYSMETLNEIHAKMRWELAQAGGFLDAIFVCTHGPEDGCRCRKPAPGLFEDIAYRYDVSLKNVPAVGDSLRDLEAATALGCAPWLVRSGKGLRTLQRGGLPPGTEIRDNLAAIVDEWLAGE